MYSDPADIKKHRFNLSVNDQQKRRFEERAKAKRMQVTTRILELALIALEWEELHDTDSENNTEKLRRANA